MLQLLIYLRNREIISKMFPGRPQKTCPRGPDEQGRENIAVPFSGESPLYARGRPKFPFRKTSPAPAWDTNRENSHMVVWLAGRAVHPVCALKIQGEPLDMRWQ